MSLYHSQHLGKTEFYFWYGQVVGGPEWECNHEHKIHDRDEPKGWGYRCKVAIFGSDPRVVTDGVAKNSEIAMAEVMLPTTGGGGIGGPVATPSIGNNSFVVGFYKDGVNAREPIIMGVLPNISQSRLKSYNSTEKVRYDAAEGHDRSKDTVTTSSIYVNPGNANPIDESISVHTNDVSDRDQYLDQKLENFRIPVSYRCSEAGGEFKGIQGVLQDAMKFIAFINTQSTTFASSVSDLRNSIDNVINKVTLFVSSFIKSIITRIRESTINLFEKTVQSAINSAPLNLRAQLVDGVKEQTDLLSCIFSLIIGGIVNLVNKILTNLLNGAVNAPMCTAESVVGDYLSQILGQITEGIDAAISGISKLFGGIINFSNQIFNALNIIFGIVNILTCQEDYACPNVEEWNFWYGQQNTSDNISEDLDKLIESLVITGSSGDLCSTGPEICGPPKIEARSLSKISGTEDFFGNAIVSPSGEILAVDIINSGTGYINEPNLIVYDCGGNGSGAVLRPVLNENGGIENIIVLDSGTGYISSPNGSTASGGLPFSSPEQTIVFSPETGYNVYNPNTNVNVNQGDLMYLPPGTTGEIYNDEGDLIQSSLGLGPSEPILILETGVLGTPDTTFEEITSNYPSSANNSYPIVLEIEDTFIRNPGINYQEGDLIIIEPSNGAELVPKFNDLGALESVEVVNPGIGFTEMPNIYIDSETGFNAKIIPIFNIKRVGDLTEEQENDQISQESIIEVIDCVGFIPPKSQFDLVPR